jgi:uncharacterized membrane protein (GlpM family)
MEAIAGKLVLSGVVGGLVVSAITVAGERYGGKLGGLIGGLPSAVIVIYLFIGWVHGPELAHEGTSGFPLAYAIGMFCVFLYVLLRNGNLVVAALTFVVVWLVLQTALVLADFRNYPAGLAISAAFLCFILVYLWSRGAEILELGAGARLRGMSLPTRILIGSAVTMAAVLASGMGGPIVASVFAAFPGISFSTLIVAHRNAGVDFSRSILAPMIISGMVNCITYVAVFRALVLDLGILASTFVAAGAVLLSALISRRLIHEVCAPRN